MATQLLDQIQCSVCLCEFTDPVCLPCEHIFCRRCITGHLRSGLGQSAACPECRLTFTESNIQTSRAVRNMVDAAKAHLTEHQALKMKADALATELEGQHLETHKLDSKTAECSKHQEKLSYYCETDQRLICGSCKKDNQHKKHKVKPIKDVEKTKKKDLYGLLDFLSTENTQLNDLIHKQTEEIKNIKERSGLASAQISLQFEELHQFLRRREMEVKNQLEKEEKGTVRVAEEKLSVVEALLREGREKQEMIQSALDKDTDRFAREKDSSHLKISANRVGLKKRSKKDRSLCVSTEGSFTSGQHYWEVEVGEKLDWEVGVGVCKSHNVTKDTTLALSYSSGYRISQHQDEQGRPVDVRVKPRKVGVYLDCERNQVSFYNADNMTLIGESTCHFNLPHSLCLFPGAYLEGKNSDPLTLCWY
ncbi:nuclear factor 7, brain-like [Chanos chanos]|uniref:Nuclear factor 7, brain-like n=1 Tax=Chanos chanos TaxID=29144 RepID=A0A6J2WBY1_CHACN|nr:nuclear factor 7, brain-like [Chanos chanos]